MRNPENARRVAWTYGINLGGRRPLTVGRNPPYAVGAMLARSRHDLSRQSSKIYAVLISIPRRQILLERLSWAFQKIADYELRDPEGTFPELRWPLHSEISEIIAEAHRLGYKEADIYADAICDVEAFADFENEKSDESEE